MGGWLRWVAGGPVGYSKVCLFPAECLSNESRCRNGDGLSMRIRGKGMKEKEKKRWRGVKGFTARSQVMDMLVLV